VGNGSVKKVIEIRGKARQKRKWRKGRRKYKISDGRRRLLAFYLLLYHLHFHPDVRVFFM